MALTDATLSLIAFKQLQNKSMTDINKGVGNESEGIFFNVDWNTIFVEDIDSDPATAVSAGVAEFVACNLVLDVTSNSQAYFAEYPTGHPKAGQRVRNAIPPAYGFLYEAKPKYTGGASVPVGDPIDWIYQYNSGIFYMQDPGEASGTFDTIELYVYVGDFLSDGLSGASGNRYEIPVGEEVTVESTYQYFVYGDLTLSGTLTNNGQVVIMNGSLIENPGSTLVNNGDIIFVTVAAESTNIISFTTESTSDKDLPALATVADGDLAVTTGISFTPTNDGNIEVLLDGIGVNIQRVAAPLASVTGSCYFSDDGGANAKSIEDVSQGDLLYWKGSTAGFELEVGESFDWNYERQIGSQTSP